MIQSIDAEAVIKQAADYLRLGKAEPMRKRGGMGRRLELSIAVERLERFERPRLLIQHMIAERFGGLDERLVSRDRRSIREKIETNRRSENWFQDLTRLTA